MQEFLPFVGAVAAAILAGLLSAMTRFRAAAIFLPLLLLLLDPHVAIPLLTVAQVIPSAARMSLNRGDVNRRSVCWFAAGAIPAAIVGGILFAYAPDETLRRAAGFFLLLVAGYRYIPKGDLPPLDSPPLLPVGAVAAFVSAVVGTAGPLVTSFFNACGLVKGAYLGTEAATSLITHCAKLLVYGCAGLLAFGAAATGLLAGVGLMVGVAMGAGLATRAPASRVVRLMEVALLVAALHLIVRG